MAFDHPYLGQVKLERWNNVHGKLDTDVPFDVVRASTHLERANPPAPMPHLRIMHRNNTVTSYPLFERYPAFRTLHILTGTCGV